MAKDKRPLPKMPRVIDRGTPRNSKGKTARPKTEVLVILDASGSMENCRDQTISAFNEQVKTIRKSAKDQDIKASLVVFNSAGNLREVLWQQPADKLNEITREDYIPDGMTAEYDAICLSLDRLGDDGTSSYLTIIVSDGFENNSKKHTQADVAERIQRLTKTGRWTFTYMGANQDLGLVASAMHIPAANIAAYNATPLGTKIGGQIMNHASMSYFSARASGMLSTEDFYGTGGGIKDATSITGSGWAPTGTAATDPVPVTGGILAGKPFPEENA